MRVHLYTSLGAVKLGLDILMEDEKVKSRAYHGARRIFQRQKEFGQKYLAAAVRRSGHRDGYGKRGRRLGNRTAGSISGRQKQGKRLEDYLDNRIF